MTPIWVNALFAIAWGIGCVYMAVNRKWLPAIGLAIMSWLNALLFFLK